MFLLQPFASATLALKNRVVMAPLTRSRADGNLPNALMAEYYGQRAGAGLVITEGTSPSANGIGYARIPGLFNAAQVAGWRRVTDAVHRHGAKVFVQLMHCGRVAHVDNLPAGAEVLAPTAAVLPGEMWTDTRGLQPHSAPRAMTEADIEHAIGEFEASARLAIEAGFDGVELHAANGYLIEQFLNANVNTRQDGWGGSAAARNRFALAVASRCAAAIGAQRVGIRLSPFGVFNATGAFDGMAAQYLDLATQLGAMKLAYLHLVDLSSMGAPPVPAEIKAQMRAAFGGVLIASGGYDLAGAEAAIADGRADLVAFGRAWIANPDLVERFQRGLPLASPDAATFYTGGPRGYTDYPRWDETLEAAE